WVPVDHIDEIKGPIMILTTATDPSSVLTAAETSSTTRFASINQPFATFEPTEISQVFVAKRLPDSTKISFRSAYDKYLGTDKFGVVSCEREAMGPAEEWEVVFRDDGVALQSSFDKFLGAEEDGAARCDAEVVQFRQVVQMRCQAVNKSRAKKRKEVELNPEALELDQIKRFHSWGGGRVVMTNEDTRLLEEAKKAGQINEALLDRRARLKSDKFCK
ncbi:FRG1-like protein, partial [Blyttiomyces helicus]